MSSKVYPKIKIKILDRKNEISLNSSFLTKKWRMSRINGEINAFITKSNDLELKIAQNKLHNDYKKFDPVIYFSYLILGIFAVLLGLILFIEM